MSNLTLARARAEELQAESDSWWNGEYAASECKAVYAAMKDDQHIPGGCRGCSLKVQASEAWEEVKRLED